jgi:hypothetical protein
MGAGSTATTTRKCQTRRLALGVLFPLFFLFFDTNVCLIVYTGCNLRQGDCRTAKTMIKSPNDVSGVVWALGVCVFIRKFVKQQFSPFKISNVSYKYEC